MAQLETIGSNGDLPVGLVALAAEARGEGFGMVDRLIADWRDGAQRFAGPGEGLVVACLDDRLVGVGGVTACPEVGEARRVRRFYVSPTARRAGLARRLAAHVMRVGFDHADTLTCHAGASPAAAPFWDAMGFEPAGEPFADLTVTHVARRPTRATIRADR